MSPFHLFHRPRMGPGFRLTAIVLAVAAVGLSGCSRGPADADLAQVKAEAASSQAQQDTAKQQQQAQASLSADVQRLKEEAAKAADAKAAADKAAADKAAADKAAADQAAADQAAAEAARTPCGGTVSAGANTTCPFALNVADTYLRSGGGRATVDVYSPVTGQYYAMTCVPGVPTVCRGGNNAVVYIR